MTKNLNYYQVSAQETMESLATTTNGLTNKEIIERQKIYGKNLLKEIHKTPAWIKFLTQFKDVLIILLIASMIVSIYLQDYRGATVLGIIVIINAIIGFVQEAKAEKIMESLKKMMFPTAKVKRNGKLIEEKAENLVPGDIIYLEEGENMPADIRIFEESNFQTNDFSLTGESSPVNKFTHAIPGDIPLGERNNCAFMGTTIATGYARGVVIATGMNTELGKIANLSQSQVNEDTPLQKEMKNVATKLTIGTVILCSVLVIITLVAHFSITEAFIFAVGIAASMVPQGLPAQVNIALTLAAGRLADNRALVKQLASVETLGCVNVICTDKTGTLTKNEMTVQHIYLAGQNYDIEGTGYESDLKKDVVELALRWKHFFNTGVLASNAKINPPDSEHSNRYCMGDPTEGALIVLAKKAGIDPETLNQASKQYHQFGFDSVRKMMSSIRQVEGKTFVYVKGAPNELLTRCTQIDNGKFIKKITPTDLKNITAIIDERSSQAMRNIAFAYKEIPAYDPKMTMEETESDLIFTGFVSIIDPARDEVPEAIKAARDAKIKIIMITGDYGPTALAIAKKIGLDKEGTLQCIPGDELKHMTDIHLSTEIQKSRSIIFSRVAPEDKLRIVNLLKKTHNVVAVTGDGINDAPALKSADIGVAMGKIGTDVAKESAEIILLDDSFHTLVGAIKEGRIIYQNLKKTTISCITSNGGELFAVLASLIGQAVFHIPMAINPIQILCIDLIGEMGPLTALTRDPAQKNLMKQAPRDTKEHIINKYVIIDLIRSGALMGLLGYGAYILYLTLNNITASGLSTPSLNYMTANAVTYTTIMFCQYANILSRRAGFSESALTSYFRSNKRLFWSIGIGIIAILLLIYCPVIKDYFRFGPMTLIDWLYPIIGGIVFFGVREAYKILVRKYKRVD